MLAARLPHPHPCTLLRKAGQGLGPAPPPALPRPSLGSRREGRHLCVPGSTDQALLTPHHHSALISPGVQHFHPLLKASVHSQLKACPEQEVPGGFIPLFPAHPVPGAGIAAARRAVQGALSDIPKSGLHGGC